MTRTLTLLALVPSLVAAAPPNKQVLECVRASEAAQAARDELRYEAARAALARCTAPGCPAVVQTDCAKWLAQLELDQPNLVIVAMRASADVTEGFSVAVDDRPRPTFKPGQPLLIDPGTRRVTVSLPDGSALTEKLVVNVGERNRRVVFNFSPLAPAPEVKPKPPVEVALETSPRQPPKPRPGPVAPLLLTGGTVAAVATFSVLGVLGNGALAPVLADPCAASRSCNPALVQPAKDLYLGANLALGAAVVFAALATWQWIVWGTSSP